MGDSLRNHKFARFISIRYPMCKYPTIAVIADGNMELSKCLRTYGYNITIFDPKARGKHSIRFKREVHIVKSWFTRDTKIKPLPSLIVAMHPDEATVEVILWAKINSVPCAVVPCCIKGDRKYTACIKSYKDWMCVLRALIDGNEYRLNINGKNRIIYTGGLAIDT